MKRLLHVGDTAAVPKGSLVGCARPCKQGRDGPPDLLSNMGREEKAMIESAPVKGCFGCGDVGDGIDGYQDFWRYERGHQVGHLFCEALFSLVLVHVYDSLCGVVVKQCVSARGEGQRIDAESRKRDGITFRAFEITPGSAAPRTRLPCIYVGETLATPKAKKDAGFVTDGAPCGIERLENAGACEAGEAPDAVEGKRYLGVEEGAMFLVGGDHGAMVACRCPVPPW